MPFYFGSLRRTGGKLRSNELLSENYSLAILVLILLQISDTKSILDFIFWILEAKNETQNPRNCNAANRDFPSHCCICREY
ncbi:hypothetical protein OSCI_4130002 [Kamptonema sp. PCC 6506]|nr:hypothetical protein OSCI_4130002 [Kamptonema sp. PCC 6506]